MSHCAVHLIVTLLDTADDKTLDHIFDVTETTSVETDILIAVLRTTFLRRYDAKKWFLFRGKVVKSLNDRGEDAQFLLRGLLDG